MSVEIPDLPLTSPSTAEPVWKRPVWITAIVGLVSALLTVPGVLGDYFISSEKIKSVEIENRHKRQIQQFEIVNNTLAQQGEERIFMLRFLNATLEEGKARDWAAAEEAKINALYILEAEQSDILQNLIRAKEELASLQPGDAKHTKLTEEARGLSTKFTNISANIREKRKNTGIEETRTSAQERASLAEYRAAFTNALLVATDVLNDMAEAISNSRLAAKDEAKNRPVLFSANSPQSPSKRSDPLEVRRIVLRAIEKYNNVLVTLAEGRSLAVTHVAAGYLRQSVGKFTKATTSAEIPGFTTLRKLINTFNDDLKDTRERESLIATTGTSLKIVERMIDTLIADIDDLFGLRVAEANTKQIDSIAKMANFARLIRDIVRSHQSGHNFNTDRLQDMEENLHQALNPARDAFSFQLPVSLEFGTSGPIFGGGQVALIELTIVLIEDAASRYEANRKVYEKLKISLNAYSDMLSIVRSAMKRLVDAQGKPVNMDDINLQLLETTASFHRSFDVYKSARSKL